MVEFMVNKYVKMKILIKMMIVFVVVVFEWF